MKTYRTHSHLLPRLFLLVTLCLLPMQTGFAQDYVTGSFEGEVKDSVTGNPVAGATVRIVNQDTGVPVAKQTDGSGRFRQGLLPPGDYSITIVKEGYVPQALQRSLPALRPTVVLPPVPLVPLVATKTSEPAPTATPTDSPAPTATPSPAATTSTQTPTTGATAGISEEINVFDARRGGTFSEKEVSTLPLGGATLTRTFDELGLLLPGVAPPPKTLGSVAGPGVGAGVGSAGQFSVNGMRSRANNFTVDGSDNNDEDIGVRRQGFFSLVPQSIESIREFQMITLLAPAQYGRNFGAQVNAISKSGGNELHGTIYGFFNSSQLNARNTFDTVNGTSTFAVRSQSGQAVLDCTGVSNLGCIARNTPITATNQSGGEDSFTLGQGGFVLGGPIKKQKAFFFVSYEKQILNATKEASFAVPTVDQRGIFRSGATGFYLDCLDAAPGFNLSNCSAANSNSFFQDFGFPTEIHGDAVFSLYPYANNPGGIYGPNTFTQSLPASARGNVLSGKYDQNFNLWGRAHTFTARYNFTQDQRDIPVTGEALFSSLRPRVRTQNFSTFLTSELTNSMSNVLRLSYGRTRLAFDELRNPYLIPSQVSPNEPFLLNAQRLQNDTLPAAIGVPNTGPVLIRRLGTTECGGGDCIFGSGIGRVGQVNVAGFSPVGVDVNYFPQRRVDNTYQLADMVSYRKGNHNIAFGIDFRRVELNSDLPRNARTLLSFNGSPELDFDPASPNLFTGNFLTGADLAAAGTPSGAYLSLATAGSGIGLRYYEWNFFAQDEWHLRRDLSINFGLRYEYNTPPREVNNLIERTFNSPVLNNPNISDLDVFLAGRTRIFDPDKNNFGPRIGLAWSPNWFGSERRTAIRAGYGVFYDQILGAVVSQSRNVFPNYLTVNTGGFNDGQFFTYFNPARGGVCIAGDCVNGFVSLIQPGTLNTLNPNLPLGTVLDVFASGNNFPNAASVTLPDRNVKTPSAEQFSVTFEQQLSDGFVMSAAYVGTRGHNLLRAATPNLGPNNVLVAFDAGAAAYGTLQPVLLGLALAPGSTTTNNFDRPFSNIGPIYSYKTSSGSKYDALQLQLRGRYNFLGATQFQVNYTYGKATDNASDVFDLAGSFALPQNSLTLAGETAPANFDARHRVSSNYISDLSSWGKSNSFLHAIFDGLQVSGTGSFQTGQPFTINSIYDVNLDGNLTDRPNTATGIAATNDRSAPFRLTVNPLTLLAPIGRDGNIGRNAFRSSNLWIANAALVKNIKLSEDVRLVLRSEAFNLFNRANYGIPVRLLEFPSFGRSTDTVTPNRRIQFGAKLVF
ncbi:MAG: carboxypeptidase regulatory-like domain-containing protein [Pyrinomonadaceae bacterium]